MAQMLAEAAPVQDWQNAGGTINYLAASNTTQNYSASSLIAGAK